MWFGLKKNCCKCGNRLKITQRWQTGFRLHVEIWLFQRMQNENAEKTFSKRLAARGQYRVLLLM